MPIAFRTVTSSKNVIRFSDRVNDKAVRDFVPTLYDVLNRGNRQMVLDFRRCERAYADAVLPIICLLDHRRERGDTFEAWLPELPTLRQLFLNANWAHYMDSAHPKLDMETRQHLAARRYGTHAEQQDAVNSVIDVVLRNMDLDRDAIAALEWSTNEITDNVLNHARSTHGGLVQVSTFRDEHKIKVVVADAGRGIPSAMRDAFPDLRDDAGAISEAVKSGVTSIPDSGQGNGLAGSLRIATYAEGSFKITSGRASLNVFRERPDSRYRTKKSRAPRGFHFPGTAVMIELSTDAAFDIGEALALNGAAHAPSDIVEVRYTSAGGDLIFAPAGRGTRIWDSTRRSRATSKVPEPSERRARETACP